MRDSPENFDFLEMRELDDLCNRPLRQWPDSLILKFLHHNSFTGPLTVHKLASYY